MRWKLIEDAPTDGSPFLAAAPVHNNRTGADSWDYALLRWDEGHLWFCDDADTGWGTDDYTHCAVIEPPEMPAKPVMLCTCGAVLETPAKYAEHCKAFPGHFTHS